MGTSAIISVMGTYLYQKCFILLNQLISVSSTLIHHPPLHSIHAIILWPLPSSPQRTHPIILSSLTLPISSISSPNSSHHPRTPFVPHMHTASISSLLSLLEEVSVLPCRLEWYDAWETDPYTESTTSSIPTYSTLISLKLLSLTVNDRSTANESQQVWFWSLAEDFCLNNSFLYRHSTMIITHN